MKKLSYLLLFAILFAACKSPKYSDLKDGLYAEFSTNKGAILVQLYAKDVPMTVANFLALVEGSHSRLTDSLKDKNFYEDVIFHRVVRNFVIQAGGFTSEGKKNVGYSFGDEFPTAKNGDLKFKHNDKGILSMANGGKATNNSQFFITHRSIPHLDGKHTVFGKTIVNSLQLKELKKKIKDSVQLKKSIDSLRMAVVNQIAVNDTIEDIKIIRIGEFANNFNSTSIFDRELASFSESEEELKNAAITVEKARYASYLLKKKRFLAKMDENNAKKTSSGLRILKLKKTTGQKVIDSKRLSIHYTLYTADGTKIKSTLKDNTPFECQLNDFNNPMITGFKEGVLLMREGEKARLFIPYYLGYGADKFGPFPAKSDLVFEVEVLKIKN
ncbi:peptidylprolyl isomerase [uncultured Polaribacter sp.]|uniref:peptidylprolyl isomerase n=1 Tax=uncultured Polaribacter sp. TaxID=174711 RepID=UPI00262F1282|nr:peptidylprolyl isomerase [uncultured Polaribacter sp.]